MLAASGMASPYQERGTRSPRVQIQRTHAAGRSLEEDVTFPAVARGALVTRTLPSPRSGAFQPQQLERVMLSLSRVTAPFRASVRPSIVTPVVTVTLVRARMLPRNVEPVPSVAELPTCQK